MMNLLERISKVQTVVSHGAACPDGIASAMIIKGVLPHAKYIFLNYNTPELDALKAEPGIMFVDFTPPQNRVEEFVQAEAVVLDHHEKQKDIVEAFGEYGVYTDKPGWSGAMLAYVYVWEPLMKVSNYAMHSENTARVASFAKLAGIRDTWQKNHLNWRLACAQAETLRFYPQEMWMSRPTFDPSWVEEKMSIGEILLQKNEERDARLVKNAAFYRSGQKKSLAAIVPSIETSDVADKLDADLVIGFAYEAIDGIDLRIRLSMRSRGVYDVGDFCKTLNGGGHKFAAGATLPIKNTELNPYGFIGKLLDDYERGMK